MNIKIRRELNSEHFHHYHFDLNKMNRIHCISCLKIHKIKILHKFKKNMNKTN